MAGVSTEQGDNKLNVELNLVPFIDLLSSLVLFLLVTAVWLQVGTIPASVESSGKARFSTTEQNRLSVHLTSKGFNLTWPKSTKGPSSIPLAGKDFNFQKLEGILKVFQKAKEYPPAAVSSESDVEYGMVIETIDSIKRSGFTTVALSID